MTMAGLADGRHKHQGSAAVPTAAVPTAAVPTAAVPTAAVPTAAVRAAVVTAAVTTAAGRRVRPLVRRLREPADAPATGKNSPGPATPLAAPAPDEAPAAGAAPLSRPDRRPTPAGSHDPGRRPGGPHSPGIRAGGHRLSRPAASQPEVTCLTIRGRTRMPRPATNPMT